MAVAAGLREEAVMAVAAGLARCWHHLPVEVVMASATGLPSGLWMQRLCFDESGPLVCPVVSGAEVPLVSLFLGSGRAQW